MQYVQVIIVGLSSTKFSNRIVNTYGTTCPAVQCILANIFQKTLVPKLASITATIRVLECNSMGSHQRKNVLTKMVTSIVPR